MHMKRVIELLLGSTLIYVVVAACSGSARNASGGNNPDGSTMTDLLHSTFDAMANPVSDANAAGMLDVATETCGNLTKTNPGSSIQLYAEHQYPGRTMAELARVIVLACATSDQTWRDMLPTGYDCFHPNPEYISVHDGGVAIECDGNAGNGIDHYVFVLPP
jgi:hypothetical protein